MLFIIRQKIILIEKTDKVFSIGWQFKKKDYLQYMEKRKFIGRYNEKKFHLSPNFYCSQNISKKSIIAQPSF